MARRLRYHLPGAIYHVMLRGNDGQEIFYDDEDRCRMCLLIQEGVERFGHRLLAFCFMSNHIHLAIQVGQINLSRIMQNLVFRYTRYINRKKKRIGHLFQGRFKSVLVDSSYYARELVRYIHLNPVRAGIVAKPEDFPWSSHNNYLGKADFVWMTSDYILNNFSKENEGKIANFNIFIHAGIGVEEELDFKRGIHEGILGSDEFAKRVKENAEIIPKINLSIPDLVQAICDLYQVELEAFRVSGKARWASNIRAILATLVREADDLTIEELASFLDREASGLSKLVARFRLKSIKSIDHQNEIARVKEHLLKMSECQA